MKKAVKNILWVLLTVTLLSCESMFHNDKLDYMWRLDSVEYADDLDLYGKAGTTESKKDIWFSFERDLVEVENNFQGFIAIGILTDNGKTLVFDFSMYDETDWPGTLLNLNRMGIDSKVSTFTVTELNGSNMVLTGSKTVLSFTRW